MRLQKKITSFESLPFMLTVDDVMITLRVSKANAYKIMASEGFPKTVIGKRVLVQKEDFKNWLDGLSQ